MKAPWTLALAVGALALCGMVYFWPTAQAPTDGGAWSDPLVDRDLEEINADTLRVLVIEHHLTYERWPMAETGLEFELLKRFARRNGLQLSAVLVQHPDSLLPLLQRGEGDLREDQRHLSHRAHQRTIGRQLLGLGTPLRDPYRHLGDPSGRAC